MDAKKQPDNTASSENVQDLPIEVDPSQSGKVKGGFIDKGSADTHTALRTRRVGWDLNNDGK